MAGSRSDWPVLSWQQLFHPLLPPQPPPPLLNSCNPASPVISDLPFCSWPPGVSSPSPGICLHSCALSLHQSPGAGVVAESRTLHSVENEGLVSSVSMPLSTVSALINAVKSGDFHQIASYESPWRRKSFFKQFIKHIYANFLMWIKEKTESFLSFNFFSFTSFLPPPGI